MLLARLRTSAKVERKSSAHDGAARTRLHVCEVYFPDQPSEELIGAGDENRTRGLSLGSWFDICHTLSPFCMTYAAELHGTWQRPSLVSARETRLRI
jgi:hypothetical protein